MQFHLKLPDITTNDSPARIVRWLVRPGDAVQQGQSLLEAETDKATVEVESAVSGVLEQVLCQAGDEVSVGQALAVFQVAASTPVATSAAAAPVASPASPKPPTAGAPASDRVPGLPPGRGGGMFARNRAAAAASAAVPTAGLPLSVAERTAAKRLQASKQTIPHFYLQTSFDASALVTHRQAAQPRPPAWDAFFVLAVARAIGRFQRFRCRFDGERLAPAGTDAIGVAIDADGELFVIPIGSPADKTVEQISAAVRSGAERLRRGDQQARRIQPALLTVSNLGATNVEAFIPIINPPEAAILGVGRVLLTPVAQDDGTLAAQHRCTITLCVDHRVASGKYAAEFLAAIVKELENLPCIVETDSQ